MYERPTGKKNNKPIMADGASNKVTQRQLIFSSAMSLAGSLGSYHQYLEGKETGILDFGVKAHRVIVRATDPQSFERWSIFFVTSSVVCGVIGILLLFFIWHKWRRKY